MDEYLLRVSQAAEMLAISPRNLWTLTDRREIPFVRIGRCIRYRICDLREWVKKQLIPATSN